MGHLPENEDNTFTLKNKTTNSYIENLIESKNG